MQVIEVNELEGSMLIDWGTVTLNHWIPEELLDGTDRTPEQINLILESERPEQLKNVTVPNVLKEMIYVPPVDPLLEAKGARDQGQFEPD